MILNNRKLKKFQKREDENNDDIARQKKVIVKRISDRKTVSAELILDNKEEHSLVFDRKIQGSVRAQQKDEATLVSFQDAGQTIQKLIQEESEKSYHIALDELIDRSKKAEDNYNKENNEIKEEIKVLEQKKKNLIPLRKNWEQARHIVPRFQKHWNAKKLAMVINNPAVFRAELNPVLAEVLNVEEEWEKACLEHKTQSDREYQLARERTQKEQQHRKSLWDSAVKMLQAGKVPPEFANYSPQELTPDVVCDLWLRIEREEEIKLKELEEQKELKKAVI